VQDHFIAITDPGSSLEKLAREKKFKYIFSADPSVGGRYSALIAFGLVPAALIGIDISKMLKNAEWMSRQCVPGISGGRNPGLVLGTIMGQSALQGKNKLTIISDPEFNSMGSWLEQLIAESSGKLGRGIIPVDCEPFTDVTNYHTDRLFIYIKKSGKYNQFCRKLIKSGHPVLTLDVTDVYDLGAEFYRWEYAIAVACSIIGVNAFDQPDVQDNKTRTVDKISYFQKFGRLDEGTVICTFPGSKIFGKSSADISRSTSPANAINEFLSLAKEHDFIAINAYLPRNKKNIAKLQKFRAYILNKTGCATTLGFGPRFLHSTGQLHKGGGDNDMFIQITADPIKDIEIPGQGFSFGTLERAQALGDLEALSIRNKRAIRIHLEKDDILDLIM
jgi:transaldolase/glucose-6-phosphate isomerase